MDIIIGYHRRFEIFRWHLPKVLLVNAMVFISLWSLDYDTMDVMGRQELADSAKSEDCQRIINRRSLLMGISPQYIGNNNPNWLSYFSEGLKPPISQFLWFWVDLITTSRRDRIATEAWESLVIFSGRHPLLWTQLFRVVNYSNLPRFLALYPRIKKWESKQQRYYG